MIKPNTILQNRYLILRMIAQGGMGAIYMAKDQRLRNNVALKETLFNQDEPLRRAFEREARLLATLRHSALPKVIDHFTEDNSQFLVMEFINGIDLDEMLKSQGTPFPISDVLNWADQLVDVLQYLHNQPQPIIHRDIKPQNLKLTGEGRVILLDFGLAKGSLSQTPKTTLSSIYGFTPHYAPLEQVQGSGTNQQSDIYSLAATLYHLMTAIIPVDALTRATALASRNPDPLRPANELNPQVPIAIADVLMKAMALNQDQRPATMEDLQKLLRGAAQVGQLIVEGTQTFDAGQYATAIQKWEQVLIVSPKEPGIKESIQSARRKQQESYQKRQAETRRKQVASNNKEQQIRKEEERVIKEAPRQTKPLPKSQIRLWIIAVLILLILLSIVVVKQCGTFEPN